jgi:hypothetical protein
MTSARPLKISEGLNRHRPSSGEKTHPTEMLFVLSPLLSLNSGSGEISLFLFSGSKLASANFCRKNKFDFASFAAPKKKGFNKVLASDHKRHNSY